MPIFRTRLSRGLVNALRHPVGVSTGVVRTERVLSEETEQRAAAIAKIAKMVSGDFEPQNVMVARADVCNNVIDSYDSRFHESALRSVSKRLPGSQMACGHDMSGWSYARMFDSAIREPEGGDQRTWTDVRLRELRDLKQATWATGDLFWPAKASWASDLQERIKYFSPEVSAHWQFELAVCSICNDDLRACDHFPGETYDEKKCWYEMRDVTEYIETSFVVKGGQYGTSTYPISEGRGVLPFRQAIRELKGSKRLFGEWRDSIRDELAAKKGVKREKGDPRSVFARALAKQTQV